MPLETIFGLGCWAVGLAAGYAAAWIMHGTTWRRRRSRRYRCNVVCLDDYRHEHWTAPEDS
jgi:hypothetical protein